MAIELVIFILTQPYITRFFLLIYSTFRNRCSNLLSIYTIEGWIQYDRQTSHRAVCKEKNKLGNSLRQVVLMPKVKVLFCNRYN